MSDTSINYYDYDNTVVQPVQLVQSDLLPENVITIELKEQSSADPSQENAQENAKENDAPIIHSQSLDKNSITNSSHGESFTVDLDYPIQMNPLVDTIPLAPRRCIIL